MTSDEAARRYAQAAFAIALDDDTVEQWRGDMSDIASTLAGSDLELLLADDRISVEERQKIVERVLDVSPKALNLARLLIAKGRSRGAGFIAEAFSKMADEHERRLTAYITSAIDLSAQQVGEIERGLSGSTGKQVTAEVRVDPSLIGGLVIRVGDQLVDGSVRTRLRRLQRTLEGAA